MSKSLKNADIYQPEPDHYNVVIIPDNGDAAQLFGLNQLGQA